MSSRCADVVGTEVAVKVRHPGVMKSIRRDFGLMLRLAQLASLLPGLKGLHLKETLAQFAAPLQEQVSLLHAPPSTPSPPHPTPAPAHPQPSIPPSLLSLLHPPPPPPPPPPPRLPAKQATTGRELPSM